MHVKFVKDFSGTTAPWILKLNKTLVSLALCYFVLVSFSPFNIAITSLGKREPILRFFDLRLFGYVCFLFLSVSGKGCGLWHSLNFSLTFVVLY